MRVTHTGRLMGTKVTRPCGRSAYSFAQCSGCKKWYTNLGIARHWPRCEEIQKRKREQHARTQENDARDIP